MDSTKFPFYQAEIYHQFHGIICYLTKKEYHHHHILNTLTLTFRVISIHCPDGFMAGEQYPESYNALAMKAYTQGRLKETGCPDIVSRADMPPLMSRVPPLFTENIPDI